MYLFLIVYRNNKDKLIYRLRTTDPDMKIGFITSMNWEVIDIQHFYKNKFYTYKTYKEKLEKSFDNYNRKNKRKKRVESIIEIIHKTFS